MSIDTRFYEALGAVTVTDLARTLDADINGDPEIEISMISSPGQARPGDLFFLTETVEPGSLKDAKGSVALVGKQDFADVITSQGITCLVVDNPKACLAKAASILVRPRIHEGNDFIHSSASIAKSARLGPGVVIGQNAAIGEHVHIGPGAIIGPGVVIGDNTRIGPRASIHIALIGNNCEISAGAVLGETGFGLAYEDGELLTLPHVGRVILDDEVTLGANVTIDRGMFDDTRLGRGCRIDNLCHIAHNVQVGPMSLMAAFAGISGSVKIGSGVRFGGRVGIADHLNIGDGASLAADAAVMKDVPPGETWGGSPAQPLQSFMREVAWLRKNSGSKKKRP